MYIVHSQGVYMYVFNIPKFSFNQPETDDKLAPLESSSFTKMSFAKLAKFVYSAINFVFDILA